MLARVIKRLAIPRPGEGDTPGVGEGGRMRMGKASEMAVQEWKWKIKFDDSPLTEVWCE